MTLIYDVQLIKAIYDVQVIPLFSQARGERMKKVG